MLLVDTNVILDVVEDDPDWADWSQTRLDAAALQYTLLINCVIYTELSIAYLRIEELEATAHRDCLAGRSAATECSRDTVLMPHLLPAARGEACEPTDEATPP